MARRQAQVPLALAQQNWAQRIDSLVNTGVTPQDVQQKVVPVMQEDLRRVQSGSQAMPTDAAILGVRSALQGHPVLQKQAPTSWNPLDLGGDIVKDIGNLTWRGIPALARYAANFPAELGQTAEVMTKGTSAKDTRWLVKHGYEPNRPLSDILDPSAWASAIRNVARTPVLGAVPGVHTVAGLTTDVGREQLLHNPVSTTLDVLPAAGALGAGLGVAGVGAAAEPGSALEALTAGHPVKALYRGALPEGARAAIGGAVTEALGKAHLHPESFGLSQAYQVAGREANAELAAQIKGTADGILEDVGKLPQDQRALLSRQVHYPDQYPPTPKTQPILDRIKSFNDELAQRSPDLVQITHPIAVPGQVATPYEPGATPDLSELEAAKAENAARRAEVTPKPGEPQTFEELRQGERRAVPERRAQNEPLTPLQQTMRDAEIAAETARQGREAVLREQNPVPAGQEPTVLYRGEPPPGTQSRLTGIPGDLDRTGRWFTTNEAEAVQHATNPATGELGTVKRIEVPPGVAEEAAGPGGHVLPEQWAEHAQPIERRVAEAERRIPGERRAAPLATQSEITAAHKAAAAAERAGLTELAAALRHRAEVLSGGLEGTLPTDTAVGTPENIPGEKTYAQRVAEANDLNPPKPRPGNEVVNMEDRTFTYTTKSPVARAHRTVQAAEENVAASEDAIAAEVEKETGRRAKAVEKKTVQVTRAQRRLDTAAEKLAKATERSTAGRGSTKSLNDAFEYHQKAVDNLEARKAQLEDAKAQHEAPPTSRGIEQKRAASAKAHAALDDAKAKFETAFKENAPANFGPMMERRAAEEFKARNQREPVMANQNAAENIDRGMSQIESQADLHGVGDPEQWAQVKAEVMATWQDVAAQGFDPIWMHNVDVMRSGELPNVRPLPDRNFPISQIKERVNDITPHVEDVAISMSHALGEYVKNQATKVFVEDNLLPRTVRWSDIRNDIYNEAAALKAKGKVPPGLSDDGLLEYVLRKHYKEWNPEGVQVTSEAHLTGDATVSDSAVYLPKHLAQIFDDLRGGPPQSGLLRGIGTSTKLYKGSIMTFSLKHMAHIIFGGTIFVAGRGGLSELFSIPDAFRMVREGEMPAGLTSHIDVDFPDQAFQVSSGKTLGRLWNSTFGKIAGKKVQLDELITNMQRSVAYLGEERRALKAGMSKEEAAAAGIEHANKALVSLDTMNPFERNVLRQVVPFYSFMRHTLRYILTYPIDHPMRAAMLARIASIEQKDWNSGLPQQFQSLFFLGSPDKNGNITGVEMRQWNPFRDTGTYFTFAGFLKALNPALQVPFSMAGVDKFTGSPELYPQLAYDPQTGNLVAKRPPNPVWNALTTYVPELGAVDYFGGFTQDLRDLKARDPEAYKRRLWSMLFLPFEPKKVNVPREAADMQNSMLAIARQDVSNATRTGNTGALQQYPVVPYQGELVQPQALTNVLNYIKKIRPEAAPRSVLPPVKLSRL